MNKTKIEWCDFSINPIKGLCKNDCPYCYAKRMYKRFKWDEHIRCDFSVFNDVAKIKKPSKIFVGSTHDIFGDWICYTWIANIIKYCSDSPQHTFIFLTKNPSRYKEFIFPQNCWLGTSIENNKNLGRLFDLVLEVNKRNKIFVSFEPLLTDLEDLNIMEFREFFSDLDWVIIGGLTPKPVHKNEWTDRIINLAKLFKIPVFLKDNLKYGKVIKEFPNE